MNCSARSGESERESERGLLFIAGEINAAGVLGTFRALLVTGGDVDVTGVCPVLFRLSLTGGDGNRVSLTGGDGNRVGDWAGGLVLSVVGGDVEDADACIILCWLSNDFDTIGI